MPGVSWHVQILPYVEQSALFAQTERAFIQTPDGLWNPAHRAKGTILPVFGCPSDAQASQLAEPFGPELGPLGLTSYLGVEGTNLFKRDGCLYANSRVKPRDITDGMSHTWLVGERPAYATPVCCSAWYTAVWGQRGESCGTLLGTREPRIALYAGCPRTPGQFEPGRAGNPCDQFHFWSFHAGGANFLFA